MSDKQFPISPSKCLSTHGGSGYAAGSYWEDGVMICGLCGTRIANPRPTGSDSKAIRYGEGVCVRKPRPSIREWLRSVWDSFGE